MQVKSDLLVVNSSMVLSFLETFTVTQLITTATLLLWSLKEDQVLQILFYFNVMSWHVSCMFLPTFPAWCNHPNNTETGWLRTLTNIFLHTDIMNFLRNPIPNSHIHCYVIYFTVRNGKLKSCVCATPSYFQGILWAILAYFHHILCAI